MSQLCYTEIESPIGPLRLVGDENGLRQLSFVECRRKRRPNPEWKEDAKPFAAAIRQLREYFAGKREKFDLPLVLDGTPFQLSVWRNLRKIPYGETVSYLHIARKIGNPQAVRAVGLANGSNPIAIIVPCHRVIGSDGSLTGFGGGLPTKQKLLALESRQLRLL